MKRMANGKCRMRSEEGFTLVELLIVIAIIAILAALLSPVFQGVLDRARKAQAKNDVTQIVTAVNAFYTEYGKYPTSLTTDAYFGSGTAPSGSTSGGGNNVLFKELEGCPTSGTPPVTCSGTSTLNTRQIVFISPPAVKTPANPRSGIATQATTINGISVAIGDFVDPWGTPYAVEIDSSYDNQMTNPYTANTGAGPSPLSIGVIAWSFGKDQKLGTTFTKSDDVISWQ